jgi:hypothetical protein
MPATWVWQGRDLDEVGSRPMVPMPVTWIAQPYGL